MRWLRAGIVVALMLCAACGTNPRGERDMHRIVCGDIPTQNECTKQDR